MRILSIFVIFLLICLSEEFGYCWEWMCNTLFYNFCPNKTLICSEEKNNCVCADS